MNRIEYTPLVALVRHGEAEATTGPDEERALTPTGQSQASHVADQLADWWKAQQIESADIALCCSPLVRARQTAAAFAARLPDSELHIAPFLRPDNDPDVALRKLEALRDSLAANHLVVVGHMPLLARICVLLESGSCYQSDAFALAEARILQCDFLSASHGTRIKRFIP